MMDRATLSALQSSFESSRRNQAVAIALLERELEDEAFRSRLQQDELDQSINEQVRMYLRERRRQTGFIGLLIVADLLLLAVLLPRWTRGTESSPVELGSARSERNAQELAESRPAAPESAQPEVPDVR